MLNNSTVRARVNDEIKEEATLVLSSIGLTISDAFRMMLFRVAKEKSLPFSPLIPNATTIAAMKEVDNNETCNIGSIDNLFKDLKA
jgi:DNA-damage-inducible protein J